MWGRLRKFARRLTGWFQADTLRRGLFSVRRVGGDLALRARTMPTRKPVDKRPGPLPEIRADGNSVTFHLTIAGAQEGARLIIRCDPDGNVWASLDPTVLLKP